MLILASLILLITDTKTLTNGFIKAKIISSGSLGSNKGSCTRSSN